MPSTYAHYRFGARVLAALDAVHREAPEAERELFDIGCQGPDIFFYYHDRRDKETTKVGSRYHRRTMRDFLEEIREGLAGQEMSPAQRSYLTGLIAHFTLDSACHPYIEAAIHARGAGHEWIEGELERYLMAKDGEDPVRFRMIDGRLVPSARSAAVIAGFYPGVPAAKVEKAIRQMVTAHHLLYTPTAVSRGFVDLVLKAAGHHHDLAGHIVRPKPYPGLGDVDEELDRRLERAVPLAALLTVNAFSWLRGEETADPYFDRTFGAGKDWKKIAIPPAER